jgi:hypothetical protein
LRLRDNAQAAEAAETAGFDFISVQDHPYVPDFLDTFALIGTLIGVTSRIRFMTDVANLPLRRDSGELVDEYLTHAGRVLSRAGAERGGPARRRVQCARSLRPRPRRGRD